MDDNRSSRQQTILIRFPISGKLLLSSMFIFICLISGGGSQLTWCYLSTLWFIAALKSVMAPYHSGSTTLRSRTSEGMVALHPSAISGGTLIVHPNISLCDLILSSSQAIPTSNNDAPFITTWTTCRNSGVVGQNPQQPKEAGNLFSANQ